MRTGQQHQRDIPGARCGLHRRRRGPDRVRLGLHHLSALETALYRPIIGLVATLAPTIGPTVGGYLTDWFSWHWLFASVGVVTAAA